MRRREFIKASGIAGAALAFGACGPATTRAAGARTEVIVIGSGMAGLAAAAALAADDWNVVVLEGRDRIGGRTFTSNELGTPVDLGAAWIHGPRGNPLTQLAKRARARLVTTDNDSESLAGAADEDAAERECERLMAGLERLKGRLRRDISIAEGLERLGAPVDSLDPAVRFCFDTQIEQEVAGDLATLSLAALDEDEELPGGDRLVLPGYSKLVRVLARGLDVRTGHTVERIERSGRGVAVHTNRGVLRCERAVVTLPIGVLKSGAVEFAPGLPAAKRRAVKRLGAGVLNKVALRYPEQFWPDDYWLGVLPGTGNPMSEFLNVAAHGGPPVVVGFASGSRARALEAMPDDAVVATARDALARATGRAEVPAPEAFLVTRWASDPFARCSYSNVVVGASHDDYEALAEPVGRVHFAGEATNARYPGTAHGAYLSGRRAAREISAA